MAFGVAIIGPAITVGVCAPAKCNEWIGVSAVQHAVAVVVCIGGHSQTLASGVAVIGPTVTVRVRAATQAHDRIGVGNVSNAVVVIIGIFVVADAIVVGIYRFAGIEGKPIGTVRCTVTIVIGVYSISDAI